MCEEGTVQMESNKVTLMTPLKTGKHSPDGQYHNKIPAKC